MKNIHILPTGQPSRLVKIKDTFFITSSVDIPGGTFYNIYITSSEEIKEGVNQWYLDKFLNKPRNSGGAEYSDNQNVIILSTDPTLIADGVQAIDDESLKWFVKNPTCEFVEVDEETHFEADKSKRANPLNGFYYLHKIIIPQEEPKQESHICKYCNAETTQPDDECYAKPKQETLEEAAYQARRDYQDEAGKDGMNECIMFDAMKIQKGFELGGKWQAERMYSEEELKLAYNEGQVSIINSTCVRTEEWFKQFKKK
jgi:hypothetical protein